MVTLQVLKGSVFPSVFISSGIIPVRSPPGKSSSQLGHGGLNGSKAPIIVARVLLLAGPVHLLTDPVHGGTPIFVKLLVFFSGYVDAPIAKSFALN